MALRRRLPTGKVRLALVGSAHASLIGAPMQADNRRTILAASTKNTAL